MIKRNIFRLFYKIGKLIILIQEHKQIHTHKLKEYIRMKALMTNSTQPDIFSAKMRDQMYLRHLRQVQKINNREALNLKTQIKQFNNLYQSHQKSKKQAKQFDMVKLNHSIQKKNQQINQKIKNIKSLYNFNNLKKIYPKNQSLNTQNQSHTIKYQQSNQQTSRNQRYQVQNEQTQQINKINQQISQSIVYGNSKTSRLQQPKPSRLSLHYYLRKRQQEMIEYENEKLKKGILTQKSVYSSPKKKLNRSIKLPKVKSARHNFNQEKSQIVNYKALQNISNQSKLQNNEENSNNNKDQK